MKKLVIIIIVLVIAGSFVSWYFLQQSQFKTAIADVGEVIGIVSETGELVSQKDFNFKFKVNGNVENINVDIGDTVKQGDVLLELDDEELMIQLSEAEAALGAAQANLTKVREGARIEDIQVYKTAKENAQITLENSKKELESIKKSTAEEIALAQNELESARVDSENIKAIADDDLFNIYQNIPNTLNDSLLTTDQALDSIRDILDLYKKGRIILNIGKQPLYKAEANEEQVLEVYSNTKDFIDSIGSNPTNQELDVALNNIQNLFDEVQAILSEVESILDRARTGPHMSQVELDNLNSVIDGHNTNIIAKINRISSIEQNIESIELANQSRLDKANNIVTLAEQKLSSVRAIASAQVDSTENAVRAAQGALKSSEDSLKFKEADPRGSDINFYQATVNQAQSNIDLINEQFKNLKLTAPADGLITFREAEVGEFISAGQTVIAMIADKAWQVEVYIAEEDILKVQTGDLAQVIFDAYGKDQIFGGKVFSSEPQRTIIEDTVYYKTIVILDKDDKNFRNGMTTDVDIITSQKSNVVRIDKRALKDQNGKFIVRIKNRIQIEDREVVVGLIGADYAEIISGLNDGEEVIISKK